MDNVKSSDIQLLIDQKIADLENSIRLLKHERNEHSLISKLPPEVMGKIFTIVASTKPPFRLGRTWSSFRQFNFSYVSQYWRDVALSTPSIWGTLPSDQLAWSRVLLERSKTTDLSLDSSILDSTSAKAKFTMEVIQDHGYRLKELKIRSTSSAVDIQPVFNYLPLSAPRLRTLCLAVEGNPVTIPQGALADVSLSILELKNCTIDWGSSLLVGLRELKIHNTAYGSPSDVLDALRNMPFLTHLELVNALPSGDLASNARQVSLPHLLKLDLSSSTAAEIANLLCFLALPRSATVDLKCKTVNLNDPSDPSDPQWPSLISALDNAFSSMTEVAVGNPASPAYRSLSVSQPDPISGYLLQAWRKAWQPNTFFNELEEWNRPKHHHQFSLRILPSNCDLLEQLVHTIPLSQLRILSLSGYIKHTNLISIFGDLPNLDTIVVDGTSSVASQIVQAMMHRNNDTEESYYRPPFRSLETLTMNCVVFAHESANHIACTQLINCLIERVERGAPIQKLIISEAYELYESGVQDLKEIVPQVEWDGRVREYYASSAGVDEDTYMYDMHGDFSDYDDYGDYHLGLYDF